MKMVKPPILLMIVMMMAPQILETLYSPALTLITQEYGTSAEQASQTLSIYFVAFALGVAFWGWLSDRVGRRTAMLAGLVIYLLGAVVAVISHTFSVLMLARVMVAFGAAVGSVVTQTMMRDSYSGSELGRVFSVMGMALAISPILGMVSGGLLAGLGQSLYVFLGQLACAFVLLLWCWKSLPETLQQQSTSATRSTLVMWKVIKDRHIWLTALLVTGFNVMIFSYYSLAPFMFEQLGLTRQHFGYSGVLLAMGSFLGAYLNRVLINQQISGDKQILIAIMIALLSALSLLLLQESVWFVIACACVMVAFGLAIPNLLSQALVNYQGALGTAGALLGLIYYLFIGCGLALVGLSQHLFITLLASAVLCLCCWKFLAKARVAQANITQ